MAAAAAETVQPGALVRAGKKSVWSPKPRWGIKRAGQFIRNPEYSRWTVPSDGMVAKYVHLSEHAGPPTTGTRGDPNAPSRLPNS